MEFNPVIGSEISKTFFSEGKCCVEPQIESYIWHYLYKVCGNNIVINKSKLAGGTTDGIIKLFNDNGEYLGFIINESKRDQLNAVTLGTTQAMFYAGSFLYDLMPINSDLTTDKFIGIFVTTAYEFIFIPKKDLPIKEFRKYWSSFNNMSPNNAAKFLDFVFSDFKYNYRYRLNSSFRLDELMKNIFEQNY